MANRVRVGLPWDVKARWLETVVLPLTSALAGWSLLGVMVTIISRAVPALVPLPWALPLALLILLFSTYLGSIQYYLQLPYSIRICELLFLTLGGASFALRGLENVGSLWFTLAIICGAWTLAMHFSFNISRVWPDMFAVNGSDWLRIVFERASRVSRVSRDDSIKAFAKEFPLLMLKLAKLLVCSILMACLIRPDAPETVGTKVIVAILMACFVIAALISMSTASLLVTKAKMESGIYQPSQLSGGWLRAVGILIIVTAIAGSVLPSAVSPIASPGLSGVAASSNKIMGELTRSMGEFLTVGRDVELDQVKPIKGLDKVQSALEVALVIISQGMKSDSGQRQWSVLLTIATCLGLCVCLTAVVACVICFLWLVCVIRKLVSHEKTPLPAFPLKSIFEVLAWPLAFIRIIANLLSQISSVIASLVAGRARDTGESLRLSLRDLTNIVKVYSQAIPGVPKDPVLFIRFVFGRFTKMAARCVGLGGKSITSGEYAGALVKKFPGLGRQVTTLRRLYEGVRYGHKHADMTTAREVGYAFSIVRKGLREGKSAGRDEIGE